MIKKNKLQGKIFIISAPSGVGKSSLIKELLKIKPLFQISISHTTRFARIGEKHGQHYYFISKNKFKNMIKKNSFIEYAKVFGNYYGTSKKSIESFLLLGIDIILDINWKGAKKIREIMPKRTVSIFILPPSSNELNLRLIKRGLDSKCDIEKRMQESIKEIIHYHEYDYLIVNDNFDIAFKKLNTIIKAENLKTYCQKFKYKKLIKNLIKKRFSDKNG